MQEILTEEPLLNEAEERQRQVNEAKYILSYTDRYYARKLETGEEIPEDVTIRRAEAREFLRSQEDI